jgi:hypothetical protein
MRHRPNIMCAKCKREVVRYEWSLDLEKDAFEIRVECHGQHDKCYLPRNWALDGVQLGEAWAFRDALPAPPPGQFA